MKKISFLILFLSLILPKLSEAVYFDFRLGCTTIFNSEYEYGKTLIMGLGWDTSKYSEKNYVKLIYVYDSNTDIFFQNDHIVSTSSLCGGIIFSWNKFAYENKKIEIHYLIDLGIVGVKSEDNNGDNWLNPWSYLPQLSGIFQVSSSFNLTKYPWLKLDLGYRYVNWYSLGGIFINLGTTFEF